MKINRKTIAAISAIAVFAVIGSIILGYGINQTLQGTNEQKDIISMQHPMNYTIVHPFIEHILPTDQYSYSFVRSLVVAIQDNSPYFVNEPINYSAIAFVNDKNLAHIVDIVAIRSDDNKFDLVNESQISYLIDQEKTANHVIELSADTNPPYYKEGNLTFPIEQHVSYRMFLIGKDHGIIDFGKYLSGLYIQSELTKIQYKTNEATLQQIEQSKQQVISQTATNDIVIGLTYVIIGLVPLALSAEIIIHKYLI